MTAKISKWGNSAAIRLPKELMEGLDLGVGDEVVMVREDRTILIRPLRDRKERIAEEARRIAESARREYAELEGSLGDGL